MFSFLKNWFWDNIFAQDAMFGKAIARSKSYCALAR